MTTLTHHLLLLENHVRRSTHAQGAKHNTTNPNSHLTCPCTGFADDDVDRIENDGDVSVLQHRLCHHCVRRGLQMARERQHYAFEQWKRTREECHRLVIQEPEEQQSRGKDESTAATIHDAFQEQELDATAELSALQQRSMELRERLTRLKQQMAQTAIQVCTVADTIQQRQQAIQDRGSLLLSPLQQEFIRIEKALKCPHTGTFPPILKTTQCNIRVIRFRWALAAFTLHQLQVEAKDLISGAVASSTMTTSPLPSFTSGATTSVSAAVATSGVGQAAGSTTSTNNNKPIPIKKARGIGKIAGLPLPHSGPELYGVLPTEELESALRMVASLVSLVSRCLGILLPHPLLLHPGDDGQDDIANIPKPEEAELCIRDTTISPPASSDLTASVSSILSMASRASQMSKILRTPEPMEIISPTHPSPSMDPVQVHHRVQRSRVAWIAERHPLSDQSSIFALRNDNADHFAVALQLLQNDVIALCIRAGVPVTDLWPAEAVLLNLHALELFCRGEVVQLSP